MQDRPSSVLPNRKPMRSADAFDTQLYLVSTGSWLALLGAGIILFMVLLWGLFGTISTEVLGKGLLLRKGGIFKVVAVEAGQVLKLYVAEGDLVKKNQVIAELAEPSTELELRQKEKSLESKIQSAEEDTTRETAELQLKLKNLDDKRRGLQEAIVGQNSKIEALQSKVASRKKLLSEGLISESSYQEAVQGLSEAQNKLHQLNEDLNGIVVDELKLQEDFRNNKGSRDSKISQLKTEIETLRANIESGAKVTSQYEGRVIQMLTYVGDYLQAGQSLVTIENSSDIMQGLCFVSEADGKKVRVGMPVQVTPSTVKREAVGSIKGKVLNVSLTPLSEVAIMRMVENEQLVKQVTSKEPPFAVTVELMTSDKTPTGFEWTLGQGPNIPIETGTWSDFSIEVQQQAPYELIMPSLRKL